MAKQNMIMAGGPPKPTTIIDPMMAASKLVPNRPVTHATSNNVKKTAKS
jgi:hypothetical protein